MRERKRALFFKGHHSVFPRFLVFSVFFIIWIFRDVFGVLEVGAKLLYEGWISAHARAEASLVFRQRDITLFSRHFWFFGNSRVRGVMGARAKPLY